MESISSGVINVHVDPKDKEEVTNILKGLGLNMSTLINMTLKQVIKRNGVPFEITNPKPSNELLESLQEIEEYKKGKIELDSYENVEDLRKSLIND